MSNKHIRNALPDKENEEKTDSLVSKMMEGEILSYTILGKAAIVRKLEAEFQYKTDPLAVERAFRRLGYEKGLLASFCDTQDNTPNISRQLAYIDSLASSFCQKGEPVIYVDGQSRNWFGDMMHQEKVTKNSHGADGCSYLRRKLKELKPGQVYIPRAFQQKISYIKAKNEKRRNPGLLVETIAAWCDVIGEHAFPNAKRLFVVCASSWSQGERKDLLEYHLFQLAMSKDIEIFVSYMPCGRYRWRWKQEAHRVYLTDPRKRMPSVVNSIVVTVIPFRAGFRSFGRTCHTISDIFWLYKLTTDIFDTVDIRRPRFCKRCNFSIHGFQKKVIRALSSAEKEEAKKDGESSKHEAVTAIKQTAKQMGIHDDLEVVFKQDKMLSLRIIRETIKVLSGSIAKSMDFLFWLLEGEESGIHA